MKHAKSLVTLVSAVAFASGCASQPDKIAAESVSPLMYQPLDCDQIGLEMDRVGRRVGYLYTSLKTDANNDAAQMAVGLIFFWPTLFLLEGGDGPEASEYARLRGEYDALQQVAVHKRCDARLAKPIDDYIPKKEQVASAVEESEGEAPK